MSDPQRPRIQFTTRNLILATAFFGLALGAWLFQKHDPDLSGFRVVFVYAAIVCFGAGVGSLFGKPMIGAAIAFFLLPAAPTLFTIFGP